MKEITIIINEPRYFAFIGDLLLISGFIVLGISAIYYNNIIWSVFSILLFVFAICLKLHVTFSEKKFINVETIEEAIKYLEERKK